MVHYVYNIFFVTIFVQFVGHNEHNSFTQNFILKLNKTELVLIAQQITSFCAHEYSSNKMNSKHNKLLEQNNCCKMVIIQRKWKMEVRFLNICSFPPLLFLFFKFLIFFLIVGMYICMFKNILLLTLVKSFVHLRIFCIAISC